MKKIALFHLENFQTKVFWKFLSTTFLLNLFQFQGTKKTNTAKSTRIWAPRLPRTCHYIVCFSSLDYLGQFRVCLLLTLPASHGSCWGWANPVWISTLPELWRWSLRMMSECHCRRCHIDESVRGTSLHQTTTQRDPCNTTQTECVLFYSQVCTCLLGPWVTPGGGNYVIINI